MARKLIGLICGSMRFKDDMEAIFRKINSDSGAIYYLMLPTFLNSESKSLAEVNSTFREALILEHLKKMQVCDFIYVFDKDGYIGDGTRYEIVTARLLNKDVLYYSKFLKDEECFNSRIARIASN